MLNVYEQIDRNKQRSILIIGFFILFVIFISWVFSRVLEFGPGFIGLALIFSGMTSFASYYWSDKIILGLSGARPADRHKDFLFYTVAQNLSLASQIPQPRLYVIDDTAMNAFATGRDPDHAVVCATTGLLEKLNRTELEGVVAHEISHIRNFDIRLMSLVTILVGMVVLMSDWMIRSSRFFRGGRRGKGNQIQAGLFAIGLLLALLSPLFAKLIQFALSRRQEYLADASAVKITRQPSGLISALRKLSSDKEPLEAANKATAHLYIVNPLKNLHSGVGWFASLFMTHPPIEKRIQALEAMS